MIPRFHPSHLAWNAELEKEIERYIWKCKEGKRVHREISLRLKLWDNLLAFTNFVIPASQTLCFSIFAIKDNTDVFTLTLTGAVLGFTATVCSRVYTYLDFSNLSQQHAQIANRYEEASDSIRRELSYPTYARQPYERLSTQAQLHYIAIVNAAPNRTIELFPCRRCCKKIEDHGDSNTDNHNNNHINNEDDNPNVV